jgi:hypothetical protein
MRGAPDRILGQREEIWAGAGRNAMRRVVSPLVLVALVALALPALASAGLPRTSDPLIEPGKSLGGIKLKMPLNAAAEKWGRNRGDCNSSMGGGCLFKGKSAEKGTASFTGSSAPGVRYVSINAGQDSDGDFVFETKLARFKTKAGIGLGSKAGAVKRAYPHAVYYHGDGDFFVFENKHGQTDMYLDPDHRVNAINVFEPGG